MSQELDSSVQVKISRVMRAKPWQVFRRILRVQEFPQYMPNVKECQILEKQKHKLKTRWSVVIDGLPITWTEEETVDRENFRILFRAVDGDLEKFDGSWMVRRHPMGTEVEIEVQAKIGIPVIEQMVAPYLEEKIAKNFTLMLDSINNKIVSERYLSFKRGKSQAIGGFAIIGHPYNMNNLIRYLKYLKPEFRPPSREFLSKIYELVPPYVMYDIEGFRSKAGAEAHGLVIVSTFVPDMLAVDIDRVFNKVVEACRVAEMHHIGIAALGGFTSIAGERFGNALRNLTQIPLTTGNTFTVHLALEGVRKACGLMGINLAEAKVCVIGGTGDIGGACARIIAEEVNQITVTGRNPEKLERALQMLQGIKNGCEIKGTLNNQNAVKEADVVIAAASVTNSIIDINSFKSGAVICDLAYPKNISYISCDRNDILIFSGGLTEIPGEINLGFEIGLPSQRTLYGCFAEAILLDCEKRYESFSYGTGNITREKVAEVKKMANRHGFELAPFYWGDRRLDEAAIRAIRKKAGT